jgi:hypothetical protein
MIHESPEPMPEPIVDERKARGFSCKGDRSSPDRSHCMHLVTITGNNLGSDLTNPIWKINLGCLQSQRVEKQSTESS